MPVYNPTVSNSGGGHIQVHGADYQAVVAGTWACGNSVADWVASMFHNGATKAINNEFTFNVYLPMGTYSIRCVGKDASDGGILTLVNASLGGTILTQDQYGGGTIKTTDVTGLSVTTSGVYTIRAVVASKNASSSSYYIQLSHVTFWRTA